MSKKISYRDRTFSIGTKTGDGSRVKDIVKWKDGVESRKSHDAIMRKVERNKAKFSC